MEKSPVSILQEICAKRGMGLPEYTFISSDGQSHCPVFVMECSVGNIVSRGTGNRKKQAKEEACKNVLFKLMESRDVSLHREERLTIENLGYLVGNDELEAALRDLPSTNNNLNNLILLSEKYNFALHFYPRGNGCIIKMGLSQVVICYGTGFSEEDAKENAAFVCLEYLKLSTE
jgi:hypothetical protein